MSADFAARRVIPPGDCAIDVGARERAWPFAAQ
jgi:hypothetical protein